MKVCANVPKEVAEYYQNYDLNKVVDILLEQYDITTLPAVDKVEKGKRVQLILDITNEEYIATYNFYGPRSTKISLARLLDFGYNMLVLDNIKFDDAKVQSNRKQNLDSNIVKALEYLNMEYALYKNDIIKQVIDILEQYKETYHNE